MTAPARHAALLLALATCAGAGGASAQAAGEKPLAAVVLIGEEAITAKEVERLLQSAIAEMRASSGYALDAVRSLQAGSEAMTLGCALEPECLLRVSEQTEVEALLAIGVKVEGRRALVLDLLWVAADARGRPRRSGGMVARNPEVLDAAVRASVRDVIPDYARRGVGGLTVLAEAGAQLLIDGQPVGRAPMERPVILSAGIHRVDVVLPGGGQVSRSVDVAEARRQVVDIPSPTVSLTRGQGEDARPARALRTASFAVGGAGALALVGGVAFGGSTLSLNRQLRDGRCAATPCESGLTQRQALALHDRAGGHAILGNVGMASGLFLAAGAGVLYWLSGPDDAEAP